jgi:hypothetical protein
MFGAGTPGITFAGTAAKKQNVLLDFRHVPEPMRRFMLQWVFDCLMQYIKSRGRSDPFAVIFDEFPQMVAPASTGTNPLVQEFDTLVHGYARSSQVALFLGIQSPLQLDDQVRQIVLSLGSTLIGQQATPAAARLLADSLLLPDPFKVKHYRKSFHYVPPWNYKRDSGVIDEPQFLPLIEQQELYANMIRKLHQYQFLLKPAVSEGEIGTAVYPISLRTVDPGQFPERDVLEPLYPILAARSGTWVDVLLKEQEARLNPGHPQEAPRRPGIPRHRSPKGTSEGTAPAQQEPKPAPEPPRRTIQRRRLVT